MHSTGRMSQRQGLRREMQTCLGLKTQNRTAPLAGLQTVRKYVGKVS